MSATATGKEPAAASCPLIAAVRAADHARAAALLDAGHDVHERGDEDWTALCFAAGQGDLAMIHLLLARGADGFAVGHDRRTPYLIALAASHREAARELRQWEESHGGDPSRISSASWQRRPYCKAYQLVDLSAYGSWPAGALPSSSRASLSENPAHDDELVFIHDDYSVTRSIWRDTDVVFDGRSADWRAFCDTTLNFRVPGDLDDEDAPAPAGGKA